MENQPPDNGSNEELRIAKAQVRDIISALESVRERPRMHIPEITGGVAETFIYGFTLGWLTTRSNAIDPSKYNDAVFEAKVARGWHPGPLSVTLEMKKRGLSEEEIVQELFAIEIEALLRMEVVLSGNKKESMFRRGFWAASRPYTLGVPYEEALDALKEIDPEAYEDEAFRRGYERSQWSREKFRKNQEEIRKNQEESQRR